MELWLPDSVKRDIPQLQCTVPTGTGICGKRFYEHQREKLVAHVEKCSRRHEDAVRVASPSGRMPAMFGPWDAEYEDYVHRTGKV